MSLKSSGGKNPSTADGGNPSPEGIEDSGSANNNTCIDQPSLDMADISTYAGQEDEWEAIAKKSKSRGGGNAAKQWGSWGHSEVAPITGLATNSGTGEPHRNNWQQTVDSRRQAGKGNSTTHSSGEGWESLYMVPPPAVQPPLQHGWQWTARSSSFCSQSKVSEDERNQTGKTSKGVIHGGSSGGHDFGFGTMPIQPDDGSDCDDFVDDTDDDLSDDYDSDVSQKSNEMRKKIKWFRVFFETLDTLSVDQINEPARQWHCPACHGGPGSIDWYRGLQPLMTHAKTKGVKRIRLHRELAELLEEEVQRRGISVILAGEAFGRWKGLHETTADHDIVWPPMVVVMNTVLEQDENDKWIGMGSQELLEYFQSYAAVKSRHSYGPHGHRGISVLIFEASAIGYTEAERLHRHFADEGKDRDAWEHHKVLFYPGGKRQLYGFLASKEDMDYFNRHSQGRFQLKIEMRSYQEMVVGPMRQMNEDNRQFVSLKNKVAKLQQHSKSLEETLEVLSQRLRETMEENRILKLRTKMQHEENKEEMDQQEQFFKEQMDKVHKANDQKERIFEKLLQEHANTSQPDADTVTKEKRLREVESAKIMDSQVKEVEKLLAESDRLAHVRECKTDLRRRYLEDTLNAGKAIDEDLTRLMEYAPGAFEAPGST